MLSYYTNVNISDHAEATATWHFAALKIVILGIMRFRFLAECDAVGKDCRYHCMGNECCSVVSSLLKDI